MLLVILFLLFISIILLSISSDITKMKEYFDQMCQIMWRESMLNEDDEEEDDI